MTIEKRRYVAQYEGDYYVGTLGQICEALSEYCDKVEVDTVREVSGDSQADIHMLDLDVDDHELPYLVSYEVFATTFDDLGA